MEAADGVWDSEPGGNHHHLCDGWHGIWAYHDGAEMMLNLGGGREVGGGKRADWCLSNRSLQSDFFHKTPSISKNARFEAASSVSAVLLDHFKQRLFPHGAVFLAGVLAVNQVTSCRRPQLSLV